MRLCTWLGVAGTGAIVWAGQLSGQAVASTSTTIRAPANVAVVANDYAFIGLPPKLTAGPTLFSLDNQGKVRHELSIVLLKSGVTVAQVLESGKSITARQFSDSLVGLLVARPGEKGGGRLWVDLLPGRSYGVVCSLKDPPDTLTHMQKGMVASFVVP